MKKEKDPLIVKYQKLLSKLRSFVVPSLCKVSSRYGNSIILTTHGFSIVIIPRHSTTPVESTDFVKVVYDNNFEILEKIVNHKKVKQNYENASYALVSFLSAVKPLTKKQAKEFIEEKLNDYLLRKALADHYKIKIDILSEYFLYGNDQLEPRYRSFQKKLIVPSKGLRVKVKDSSAFLFMKDDGTRHIDLFSGSLYRDEKFLYLDSSITYLKKCPPNQADYYTPFDGKIDHFKIALKKGVDLSQVKRIAYKSADKMVLTLKKDKKGVMYFEDKKGIITIAHPDLLICILN